MSTHRLLAQLYTQTELPEKEENLSHRVHTLTEWTKEPYFWLFSVVSMPVRPGTFIYWDCQFQIALQYQLLQRNGLPVRKAALLLGHRLLFFFANRHCTKCLLSYSPSCLIQCFLLRRPPYQGQVGQSHQNTLGLLQTSTQSWLVSWKRQKKRKKSVISYYRNHLLTNLHIAECFSNLYRK